MSQSQELPLSADSLDWRASVLANVAPTPFVIRDCRFASVESALQGVHLRDHAKRREVFALPGREAVDMITAALSKARAPFVYWQQQQIPYHSQGHHLLLAIFIAEKVRQNKRVRDALLETEDIPLLHPTEHQEDSHTAWSDTFSLRVLLVYRQLLLELRSLNL